MKRVAELNYFAMAAALAMLFSMLSSCTDADVEAKPKFKVSQVDDLLSISGEVCSKPPQDSDFPVKIMFIVDASGSMQQTDEGDYRAQAVRDVVNKFADNPQVYFDIIKFNGKVDVLTEGFEPAGSVANKEAIFGSAGLLQADSQTDYQGALGVAYQELLKDMMNSDRSELTRTKYVIIFFSDGTPDPVCYGCVTEPPDHPRYSPTCNEDLHVTCTLGDRVLTDFQMGNFANMVSQGYFPLLEGGVDYNNDYQIFALVDDIMDLKDAFKVGDLRLHTAFLYCRDKNGNPTSALCAAAEAAYNLDPDRGRALLRQMSRQGNGTFSDFTSGEEINFLRIDYTSIKRNYSAKNLIVSNITAFPYINKFLPDSDSDGIPDKEEEESDPATDPLNPDTDNDGYSDFIETKWKSAGYDPTDPDKPEVPCNDLSDSDGDGLNACEEALYKTDPKLVDTDADGFPDLYEVRFNTNPLEPDGDGDLDADGRRNADELLERSNPSQSDPELWNNKRYWYSMGALEKDNNGRQCYKFTVDEISLVTTQERNNMDGMGYNDILIWFDVAAYDDPWDTGTFKVACVRVQYIAPDYKVPFDGKITIEDDDFKDPAMLDLSFPGGDCVTADR
ncbi:MAG: VWA domain-containing protein [Deltaproteobacteria bacterium]|nr:VWA domain-containing protein [Deltaproteobacteria bacterium]